MYRILLSIILIVIAVIVGFPAHACSMSLSERPANLSGSNV